MHLDELAVLRKMMWITKMMPQLQMTNSFEPRHAVYVWPFATVQRVRARVATTDETHPLTPRLWNQLEGNCSGSMPAAEAATARLMLSDHSDIMDNSGCVQAMGRYMCCENENGNHVEHKEVLIRYLGMAGSKWSNPGPLEIYLLYT